MRTTKRMKRGTLVAAMALVFSASALAQSSGSGGGDSGGQTRAGPTATTGTTSGTGPGSMNTTPSKAGMSTPPGNSPAASADTTRGAPDNTNSKARSGTDFNGWAKGHATQNKGRISRQDYMDEMSRRWNSVDRGNQGLTPAEISRLTGKVDIDQSAVPRSGSDVQAGNMGPSSVKGK